MTADATANVTANTEAVVAIHAHGAGPGRPVDVIVLAHHERRVRRRRLVAQHGDVLLLDLPATRTLAHGEVLERADGLLVEVIAGEERLVEVRGRDATHLAELAWHIGNRHLPAQVDSGQVEGARILLERDAVIERMLEGLGARLAHVSEPFEPLHGAYHDHSHGHSHDHAHDHAHG